MTKKTERVGILKIVDGDTVNVAAHSGMLGAKRTEERVRLYGIDAPESDQQGGDDATKHLKKLVGSDKSLWLERRETDRYGRTVGVIYRHRNRPADSYNYAMVKDGHAHVYLISPSDRERFRDAESEAKRKRRGIWKKEGRMIAPAAHRARGRKREGRLRKLRWITIGAMALILGGLALYRMEEITDFVRTLTG